MPWPAAHVSSLWHTHTHTHQTSTANCIMYLRILHRNFGINECSASLGLTWSSLPHLFSPLAEVAAIISSEMPGHRLWFFHSHPFAWNSWMQSNSTATFNMYLKILKSIHRYMIYDTRPVSFNISAIYTMFSVLFGVLYVWSSVKVRHQWTYHTWTDIFNAGCLKYFFIFGFMTLPGIDLLE